MDSNELRNKTKQFAVDIIRMVDSRHSNRSSDIITKQLIRSASSVGANNRATCKARSNADFISKIMIVEEKANECQ
jgi:four helix bundle protein